MGSWRCAPFHEATPCHAPRRTCAALSTALLQSKPVPEHHPGEGEGRGEVVLLHQITYVSDTFPLRRQPLEAQDEPFNKIKEMVLIAIDHGSTN